MGGRNLLAAVSAKLARKSLLGCQRDSLGSSLWVSARLAGKLPAGPLVKVTGGRVPMAPAKLPNCFLSFHILDVSFPSRHQSSLTCDGNSTVQSFFSV